MRGLFLGKREAIDLAIALVDRFRPGGGRWSCPAQDDQALPLRPVAGRARADHRRCRHDRGRAHARFSKRRAGNEGLEHVTPARALAIGVGQCFSLWPGASRSMCTIVAGQLSGLSTSTAAEFSFLLALPTLGAATLYELYKGKGEIFSAVGGTQLWWGSWFRSWWRGW